ncbi:MAG TPA: prolyl oligopeptidase family serine peptidase [Thermoanaerobaculia bacterium]|nr:prolyl oligopeptidase family serine peptidase [Thermoanaerobaculia bacterium]
MDLAPKLAPRAATTAALLVLLTVACASEAPETRPQMPKLTYPATQRVDQIDDYHGTPVPDPYRWLEDLEAEPVRAWVEEQNGLSRPFLEALPARAAIERRLSELWNYERRGVPWKEGSRYFWYRNDGLQNQDVLVVADAVDASPRVLIDPNTWTEDGTAALAGVAVSKDGRYASYARSEAGTDWRDWRVRDVETGEDLADHVTFTKFTQLSWSPDGSGFYYSRYPVGAGGRGDGSKAVSIWFHRLGTAQSEDREVFAVPEHPERNPYGRVTDDGRWLVIAIAEGYLVNAIWLLDLGQPGARARPFLDAWDARYDYVVNDGDLFYFRTTLGAPRGRLIAVRADGSTVTGTGIQPPLDLQQVIPETNHVLERVSPVAGHFVTHYLGQAMSRVEVWHPAGRKVHLLDLPTLGTAAGFPEGWNDTETFFAFESFTHPRTIYRLELPSGETTEVYRPPTSFDPTGYETHQIFYSSKDGVGVPMFLVHRRGIERTGDHPTLLYGYGGFNVSITPTFNVGRLVWLEMGGVFAVANLRGGGELGEQWHRAGTRERKQNVFDDFIAGAEHLIRSGYTSPARLAIEGASNGGLLVGAVITQRPDLFGAALADVGVLDMLRYHLPSLNARHWSDDYGLSENPDDFRAQIAYSPLHNVKPGTCYPPTLVTAADHDDRVVPWHSYKFAAALQHAQGCDHPVLLRVETRVGHGAGTPTALLIEKLSDRYAFAAWVLGVERARSIGGAS